MGEEDAAHQSPLLEAVFLTFIEEICLRAPQIDNLRATISILLLNGALLTVIGIGDSGTATDHTAPLIGAIVTLITYAHQGAGTHIGVTDHTLAITCEKKRTELCPLTMTSSPLPSSCYGETHESSSDSDFEALYFGITKLGLLKCPSGNIQEMLIN